MKLIIAGSRTFDDFELLNRECVQFIRSETKIPPTIISGTANGADKLGERFAKRFNLPLLQFPANWDKFGKRDGIVRNEEMAKIATHAIVFWDGTSKGSSHMIEKAKKYNLTLKIIQFGKPSLL